MSPRPTQPRPRPSTSPFRDQPEPVYDSYDVDCRVIHDRHGMGQVVRMSADRMDVKFGTVVVDVDQRSSKVHRL